MPGETRRTINLFCPAIPQTVPFSVSDDQRIDLGLIARTFGLEPASVKLNGHFLSRGADLIASSVTWNNLVSYFSSRNFSTGVAEPIVVDGKLCRIGTKRGGAHPVPVNVEIGTHDHAAAAMHMKNVTPQFDQDSNLPKKTKLDQGCISRLISKVNRLDDSTVKRKQCFGELSPLKRIRATGFNSGLHRGGGEDGFTGTIPNTQISCSFINERLKKRTRDDTVDVAASP